MSQYKLLSLINAIKPIKKISFGLKRNKIRRSLYQAKRNGDRKNLFNLNRKNDKNKRHRKSV